MRNIEVFERPKSHSWLYILRGAIAILFGIAILASPGAGLAALVLLFGLYAVLDGILAIVVGANKHIGLVFAGVLGILAGIAAFAMPMLTALTLIYVIAAWGIFLGVTQLFDAFRSRKEAGMDWFMALAGIAAVALGILILMNPGWGLLTAVVAAGVYAIASGIMFIAIGFRIRGFQKRVRDLGDRLAPT